MAFVKQLSRDYRLLQQSLPSWLLVQWVWTPCLLPSRQQEAASWSSCTQPVWTMCRGNVLPRPSGNRKAKCWRNTLQGILLLSHWYVSLGQFIVVAEISFEIKIDSFQAHVQTLILICFLGAVSEKLCRAGSYCGLQTAEPQVCPEGYICPEGSYSFSNPKQL